MPSLRVSVQVALPVFSLATSDFDSTTICLWNLELVSFCLSVSIFEMAIE